MKSEGITGIIATVLSQIFIGLVLGFCWNVGMTDLGFNYLNPVKAIVIWFGILTMFFIFSFINANMFKSIMMTGMVTVEPEKKSKKENEPPNDDISAV